jgi:hypothetical protein
MHNHSTSRAKGKNPETKPSHIYASLAASLACLSVVLEIKVQQAKARIPPAETCRHLNTQLKEKPAHSQVHIFGIRWTVHGNLVIIAGPNTLEYHLKAALPNIANILHVILNLPSKNISQIKANVRWSCIFLNCVPTHQ